MREVIENIINKLEKRAEEHDFEGNRFAERKYWEDYCAEKNNMNGLNEAIEIVKQEAEQYNNGWIPCSERLPEEPEITGDVEEDIYNGKLNEYIGMIYGAEKPTILYYAGERCWYDEVSQDYYPVRAWQPLPEPYQPKGE